MRATHGHVFRYGSDGPVCAQAMVRPGGLPCWCDDFTIKIENSAVKRALRCVAIAFPALAICTTWDVAHLGCLGQSAATVC